MEARVETLLRIPRLLADSSGEPDQLFQVITQQVASEMESFCGFLRVDPARRVLLPVARAVPPDQPIPAELEAFLDEAATLDSESQLAQVVRERRTINVGAPSETAVRARYTDQHQIEVVTGLGLRSVLLVPVIAHDEVLGVLSLFRRGTGARPFTEDEARFATQLSDHAAVALVNASLVERARSQAHRLRLLSELASEFATTRTSLGELLALIVKRIGETVADSCTIRLVEDDGQFGAAALYTHDPALRSLCDATCAELVATGYPGVTGSIRDTKASRLAAHVTADDLAREAPPRLRDFIERVAPASLLAVPLVMEGRVTAVLVLTRSASWPRFTLEDQQFVEELASHTSIGISNTRALEAITYANRRLEALTTAARVFATGGLEPRQVLELLAQRLISELGGACRIELDRTVLAEAVVVVAPPIELPDANLDWASMTGYAVLGLPCRAGDEVLGAIALRREASRPYARLERAFAEDLIGHAVLAIRNSRLLASVQHELAEHTRTQRALLASQEQLRHSQKMDAVGRLAGGVAHDFNNILSVVLTSCAFISEALPEGDPIAEDVEQIRKAGESAARLTRQLLLFSRQEVVAPRVLDIDDEIRAVQGMLRRLVGEHIAVSLSRPSERVFVKADPGHLEQVLMNLAVNARDAMPRGGKLSIAVTTEQVSSIPGFATPPGEYVVLAVADTGEGMSAETLERAFEPFFTTKSSGKGTGLGLSTVYGIVKLCGGGLRATSSVGVGSTFKIYLPRVDPVALGVELQAHDDERCHGTILLVEDDAAVRRVAALMFTRAGYEVIEAGNGHEALAAYDRNPSAVDLVVTDVVMPVMGGRDLAEQLATRESPPKILFMTGYTDDTVLQHHLTTSGSLLHKPLNVMTVLRKVREVLSSP